jgi:hypothetical protein
MHLGVGPGQHLELPILQEALRQLLPARFRPQYFRTRTGVTSANLSQHGPIPKWKRAAHVHLEVLALVRGALGRLALRTFDQNRGKDCVSPPWLAKLPSVLIVK